MSQVIDDVATYLAANGVGTLGTDIFEALMPPSVDNGVSLHDTSGRAPDIYLPTKEPNFQVFIRDHNFSTGETKLALVRSLLQNTYMTTLVNGGVFFFFIQAQSEGGHLGQDDNGRDTWSINFHCRTR